MKYLILFIVLTAMPAYTGRGSTSGPRITSNTTYKTEDCKEDPLTPCDGEKIVIENRWMVPAKVILSCGADLDEQEIIVPARVALTVSIEMTMPVHHPACVIKSSERMK